ncbi:hypothetical protein [Wolbachia endosymbiont of Trichogramma kaykai]|uniref:hypothetical protein n=1 Tax=Wolbachia endosymbiont of Trichogramma kaykai TaxID=444066 RepID=UPI0038922CD5
MTRIDPIVFFSRLPDSITLLNGYKLLDTFGSLIIVSEEEGILEIEIHLIQVRRLFN